MIRTCWTELFVFLFIFALFALPGSLAWAGSGSSGDRLTELAARVDTFPESARGVLRDIVLQKGFAGVITGEQATNLATTLGLGIEETALALISLAQVYAIPPISHFKVGAVAIGSSGALYFGCNLEFPGQALSFSVHGEQSAVMNAWMHGEKGVRAIAITASPCGYCRQFLNELSTAPDLEILLDKSPKTTLRALLPQSFGPDDLGIEARLMDTQRRPLLLDNPTKDRVVEAALEAAATSYAPYSGNYSGVALESADGVVIAGRYAENAAYNPSMSPLAAALALYNFANKDFSAIKRAVLVQSTPDTANQEGVTRCVLSTFGGRPVLETFVASKQ